MMMSETEPFSSVEEIASLPEEESAGLPRSEKGPLAFRTISEVADELHVPQHVLRFWETRFEQVRPLKRGGGRRYYRPADVELLRYISGLLYAKGYTVKGVQRLLREGEVDAVHLSPSGAIAEMPDPSLAAAVGDGAPEQEAPLPAELQDNTISEIPVSEISSEVAEYQDTVTAPVQEASSAPDLPHEEIVLQSGSSIAPAPAPEMASGEVVLRLEKQATRLKNDLADVLVELESLRNRLTA